MPSPTNILADLQDKFRELHANYGKMPKEEFMRRSVELVELMEIAEQLIKVEQIHQKT